MKDLYTFDLDKKTALETYDEVRQAYDWFFRQIGLPFVTVFFFETQLSAGERRGR